MASPSDNLIRYLRRLAIRAESNEDSDAALLGRFLANRDERAFAALVERHGALVLQACWRILGNIHDAQDAFQATFLVLARKAAAIRPPEALPAWLHGVARRAALKTRSSRYRHQRTERALSPTMSDPRPDPLTELSTRDFLAIIDDEVRRLAEVYRLPVILCCLEGRSIEEAARQLGWTTGSVKGRLERGRARLHERLTRRGLTLPAALAAVELSRSAASAAVAAGLAASSIPAAASVQSAALAQGILKSMALAKLKTAAALMLATCLLAGGLLAYRQTNVPQRTQPEVPAASSPSETSPRLAALAALGQNKMRRTREETFDRIEVSGTVLDPQDRPFAGAKLYVGYTPRRSEPDAVSHLPDYPLRAKSEKDGRFRFTFLRSHLDGRYLDASRPVVIAMAEGFGLDWAEIGGSPTATVNLRLVEDFPLEGRVFDAQRKPVAGAKVFARAVTSDTAANLTRYIEKLERNSATFKTCWGPLPGQPQATTTAHGRFRLTGLGRDRLVTLAVQAPAILSMQRMVMTRPAAEIPAGFMRPDGVPVEAVAVVPRSIRGVVRDKATGQAVAGVKISVERGGSSTQTDKDGHYELLVPPGLRGDSVVLTQPQNGQPYFAAAAHLPNAPNQVPLTADFELIGGIPLRGRVTEQTTGKPPRRAVVEYYPLFPNAYSSVLTKLVHLQAASSCTLQADGAYSLMVLPGPGVVLVAASPRDSYATARLDERELANLFRDGKDHGGGSWLHTASGGGGWPRCVDRYNALSLIQPDEKAKSLTLDLTVLPARPLRGIVIGPDGQPLGGVKVCGLTSMPDAEMLDGASFLVEGLNPQRTRDLSFYHEEKGLGKFLTIRGDQTKMLTVQLEPCAVVIGRVVNKAGRPIPGVDIGFGSVGNGLYFKAETDSQGRFRAALVPGIPYRLGGGTAQHRLSRRADLLIGESGKTKDLGDLLLDEKIIGK